MYNQSLIDENHYDNFMTHLRSPLFIGDFINRISTELICKYY